jgi:hypothetical protein
MKAYLALSHEILKSHAASKGGDALKTFVPAPGQKLVNKHASRTRRLCGRGSVAHIPLHRLLQISLISRMEADR